MNTPDIFRQPTAAPFSHERFGLHTVTTLLLSEQELDERTKENRRQTESVPPHYLMIDTHGTTAKLNETKEQKKTNVYHTVEHHKSAIEQVSAQVEPLCNVLGCY